MVSNQGKITTLAADADVDKGLVDGTDKLHSGIIKVLESFAQGDVCIGHAGFTITDGGDYTQYNLAQPIEYTAKGEYDSYGTNLTVAYSSTVQDATNSRYDWVLLNPSVGGTPSIVIVQGTAGTTPLVSDITADHIPIALVHISAGNDDDKTDYSFQTFTLDKGKNSLSILHGGNQIGKITGDADSIDIVSTVTDSDINITPNGNGKIVLDGLNWPIADGSANQFLQTDGSNQLSFATVDTSSLIAHTDIPDSDTGFVKRTGVETYDIDTNTYLTAESDTLDTVTGRGDSTANDITCGTITSNDNQHISFEVIDTSNPVITGGKTVVYVHDISSLGNTLQLPAPNSGSVLYIMNFFSNTITLTGNPEINAADTTHPKIVSANTIQLEPFEHVTLQATDDSVSPLSTGHYIISDGDKDRSASYATAAQGTLADSSLQTNGLVRYGLTNDETLTSGTRYTFDSDDFTGYATDTNIVTWAASSEDITLKGAGIFEVNLYAYFAADTANSDLEFDLSIGDSTQSNRYAYYRNIIDLNGVVRMSQFTTATIKTTGDTAINLSGYMVWTGSNRKLAKTGSSDPYTTASTPQYTGFTIRKVA
jgi:hypothetical protein